MKNPDLMAFVGAYLSADSWWEPLDRILLRACAEQALHQSVPEVFAKIALINRVYRANLQMGVRNAEWKLAELMVNKEVDKFIRDIGRLDRFCRSALNEVLALHEQLVCLAQEVTGRVENSFCAKYLSFHYPKIIPIFDNYAYGKSWELAGRDLPKGLYIANKNVDYCYHCEAVIRLMGLLLETGVAEPDIKVIDYVLYSSGAGYL